MLYGVTVWGYGVKVTSYDVRVRVVMGLGLWVRSYGIMGYTGYAFGVVWDYGCRLWG